MLIYLSYSENSSIPNSMALTVIVLEVMEGIHLGLGSSAESDEGNLTCRASLRKNNVYDALVHSFIQHIVI